MSFGSFIAAIIPLSLSLTVKSSICGLPRSKSCRFATMTNREWGDIGKNYLKSLFALGFQGFLIMVCVAIYAVLVQTISTTGGPSGCDLELRGLYCAALFRAV
jgi:hypothetical protein